MNRHLASLLAAMIFSASATAAAESGLEVWQKNALAQLARKYVGQEPGDQLTADESVQWIDRVTRVIGDKLATNGLDGAPAEDVAMLALLHARTAGRTTATTGAAGGSPASGPPAAPSADQDSGQQAAAFSGSSSDMGKGQEGFRQGVEKLSELPISERMAVTGDVSAGVQAIRVPGADDMSTAFGRFRLNVVTRAVPASAGGRFSDGYFFLQLRAAGGPFDSSSVGHAPAYSPFNDVATDRSVFNEGLDRGNFYLGKAFFQQEVFLGDDRGDSLLGQMGIIDFSDFFDMNEFANNEMRQYLNSAFVNSAAYKTAIGAPGAIVQYRRRMKKDWLTALSIRGGYAISRTDKALNSPLWSGELELATLRGGRRGTWRIGGSVGHVADAGGVDSFYLSVDQWLNNDIGVFGRYIINNTGPGSRFLGPQWQSFSGGLQRRFIDAEDHVSAWGIGFSNTWGIEPVAADAKLASEKVLETYYRWQVTNNFALTPDFQLITGAGGEPGTHVVVGLRSIFDF